jgi:hypothetical protein
VKLCECGCGRATLLSDRTDAKRGVVRGQPLRFVHGHSRREHGMTRTPEGAAFRGARNRCTNPNAQAWKDYGGRGIKFLFTSFEQWFAELGPRPTPEHSVDRINNDGNYEPGNVRWATDEEQNRNQRPKSPETLARLSQNFLRRAA